MDHFRFKDQKPLNPSIKIDRFKDYFNISLQSLDETINNFVIRINASFKRRRKQQKISH